MMTSLLPNMPDHGTSVASIIFSAFDEVSREKVISTADFIFFVFFLVFVFFIFRRLLSTVKDDNGCLDFCEFLMAAHCITSATPR